MRRLTGIGQSVRAVCCLPMPRQSSAPARCPWVWPGHCARATRLARLEQKGADVAQEAAEQAGEARAVRAVDDPMVVGQ